jgi:hypothetical protein
MSAFAYPSVNFAKEYAANKPTGMMLFQGHCGMWNDESFNDFVKIAALFSRTVERPCQRAITLRNSARSSYNSIDII